MDDTEYRRCSPGEVVQAQSPVTPATTENQKPEPSCHWRRTGLNRIGGGPQLRDLGRDVAALDQLGIVPDHLERGFLPLAREADVEFVRAAPDPFSALHTVQSGLVSPK